MTTPSDTALPLLVLVTGPRVLDGQPAPREWLEAQLDTVDPSVIVTGDARGPDTWAARWAERRRDARHRLGLGEVNPLRRYDLRGGITDTAGDLLGLWTRHPPPRRDDPAVVWAAWCLHRDRVMVRAALQRVREGRYHGLVVALGSDWSSTHGTAFTVARARYGRLPLLDSWWTRGPGGVALPRAAPVEGWALGA